MQPAMIYCSSCGAGNQSQAIYCFRCGQKILIGTTPPSPIQSSPGLTGRLASHHLLKGRYIITKLLGRGGMGAVYQATDTQFGNRLVAVKEMSQSHLDAQETARTTEQFRQEAHLLAGLKHPNLPSIYDHFTEDGRWYLVMDFIEGETIEERQKKAQGHMLPTSDVLNIGIQLTKVLGYLHTRPTPIIFRDLKPSNIMITPEGHVYLIDFGIARLFKPEQARDTIAYGSPGYMAPEQFNHEQTSPLSDIYSLGATLHKLLSGHNPRSNKPTVFHFESLQSYNLALPPMLIALVAQMVSIDKSQRPSGMDVIKKELESIQRQVQNVTMQTTSPTQYNPQQPITLINPQSKQEISQINAHLPKHGFLRALPIGIFASIICFAAAIFLAIIPSIIINSAVCVIAGFLTGKIAVARETGLLIGAIIWLLPFIIGLGGGFIAYYFHPEMYIFMGIVEIFLSLFGAWFATRKHPYYAKINP